MGVHSTVYRQCLNKYQEMIANAKDSQFHYFVNRNRDDAWVQLYRLCRSKNVFEVNDRVLTRWNVCVLDLKSSCFSEIDMRLIRLAIRLIRSGITKDFAGVFAWGFFLSAWTSEIRYVNGHVTTYLAFLRSAHLLMTCSFWLRLRRGRNPWQCC